MRVEQGTRLRSFVEVATALTQNLDLGQVLVDIVERAMELTGARYGAVLTLTAEGEMESFLHRGLTEEQVAALPHLPRGKGLLGVVLEERTTVCVPEIGEHPASVGFPSAHVPMRAFLGTPMVLQQRLVGALYLTKPPGEPPFSEDDEELVEGMASMAAVGIQNARMFATERARAEHAAVLREVSGRVRESLDVERVLETTVETLGRTARVDRCFIRLSTDNADEGPLGPVAYEWCTPGVDTLLGRPVSQFPVSSLAAQTRSTQLSEDVAFDARLSDPSLPGAPEELERLDTRAVLATPLLWGDDVLGVVAFHSSQPRRWTHAEVALIEGAAREVSAALNHARLYDDALAVAERLREVDQMRSDFVSTISHELRSPMTVVAGIADILEKRFEELPAEGRIELLETLGREARRLTRLVSDVLDLESTDRAVSQLRLEEVDLVALARESVADAGEASRTKLVAEAGDAIARGDRDRLKQVILNLLSNAAKFSPPGSPITVTVSPQEEVVRVSVRDEGPGIPEEQQHLLFQRFSRLASAGPPLPGSGIGLYLCKTIVDRHGGTIWVESSPGEGSTFSFSVPR